MREGEKFHNVGTSNEKAHRLIAKAFKVVYNLKRLEKNRF